MLAASGTHLFHLPISGKKMPHTSRSVHRYFMRASSKGDMLAFVIRKLRREGSSPHSSQKHLALGLYFMRRESGHN
jgi:hypothetical protein